MSASSVLLVAASIVAAEGHTATIDAGTGQHLEPGDRGQAYYELIVDGVPKRIDVGPVIVTAVTDTSASLESEAGHTLRAGYRAELRLPVDRIPETQVSVAPPARPAISYPGISRPLRDIPPSPPPTGPAEPIAPDDYPEHTLPAVPVEPDPPEEEAVDEVAEDLDSASKQPAPAPVVAVAPIPVPAAPVRDVVHVSSGTYSVGLDPPEAEFFDQTPRHKVALLGFAIDRRPMEGDAPTGLSFDEAQAHCEEFGLRLPTEQEWEVAAQVPGFVIEPGLFDWTSSWYQAYPGNSRQSEEYGQSSRVLRGIADWSEDTLHSRRFMNPRDRNSKVGFRCLKDSE